MKYFLIIIQVIFIYTGSVSQSWDQILEPEERPGWINFKPNFNTLPLEIFEKHKSTFGLSEDDSMDLIREEVDNLGFTHFRFQQVYKGLKVEGAEFITHSKQNKALNGNGKIISGLNVSIEPTIHSHEAINIAKQYMNAMIYMWEDKESEQTLKSLKNDMSASYFPIPELIMAQSDNSDKNKSNYRLTYRVEINTKVPFDGKAIYIDAHNGEVLKDISLHTNCTPGEGCTLYNGPSNQEIDTDPVGSDFRLFDDCRGDGIHTRTFEGSAEINDDNNIWTDAAQCPGVSAHWGLEQTYDYYQTEHSRNSYDNDGAVINGFVENGVDGAFWSTGLQTLNFGVGGGGLTTGDLVSLDIVGHEFTHAVTQFSANLIYADESGALNESFSDIFGTVIEFYVEGEAGNYLLGEDIWIIDGYLRNMSNPKAKTGTLADAPSPDTYLGEFWTDDLGVHFGSGVQNFWFYLLAEGSGDTDGINDNGDPYVLAGIGLENAAAIAYRNLTVYLTSASGYAEARNGSVQAAIDLFGECSVEMMEVLAAWDAVGVYDNGQCQNYLTIPYLPIPSDEYESQICIFSTGIVQSGSDVIMHAGERVTLSPGFTAEPGADFHAFIEGCNPNGFNISSPGNDNINDILIDDVKPNLVNQTEKLIINTFPNPFSEKVVFEINLPETSIANLEIYDYSGKLIRILTNNEEMSAGIYNIPFESDDLAGGIYFYRFWTGKETVSGKLILNK